MRVRRLCGAALWILLPVSGSSETEGGLAQKPVREGTVSLPCWRSAFTGSVSAGHSFRGPIGGGLDFVLEAVPRGWIMRVLPSSGARAEQDFAEVATPPFHSINPLLLTTDFGFRAQDVIGWNPRTFRYVGSAALFAGAQRAYRAVTSSKTPTREQETAVTGVVMKAREGRLEIVDAELVPGTGDQTASARLLASHIDSTAHTVRPAGKGLAGPLGEVMAMRFQVWLSVPNRTACQGSTTLIGNH